MNRKDMNKPNAVCAICGKDYYRCAKCIRLKNSGIETWKLYCDTHDCYKVFLALKEAEDGVMEMDVFDSIIEKELPEGRSFTMNVIERIDDIHFEYSDANYKCEVE